MSCAEGTDEETGLWSYSNRYYNAVTGRFISRDPLGYIAGMNPYQYVRSSPAKYTDAFGHQEKESTRPPLHDHSAACCHLDEWCAMVNPPLQEGEQQEEVGPIRPMNDEEHADFEAAVVLTGEVNPSLGKGLELMLQNGQTIVDESIDDYAETRYEDGRANMYIKPDTFPSTDLAFLCDEHDPEEAIYPYRDSSPALDNCLSQ